MTINNEDNRPGPTCDSCGTVNPRDRDWCQCGADLPETADDEDQDDGQLVDFTIPPDLQPAQQLVYLIDQMLDNPVDKHGNRYDLRYLKPALAFHFARVWPAEFGGEPVAKRREYPNGFVEWVPLDAPDLAPDPLDGLTMADIAKLPPEQRDVAIRRLQSGDDGPVADPDSRIPWVVRTNIQIDEEALQ